MAGDEKLDWLPVETAGKALLALHRAKALRDQLADRWLPAPLAELAKNPVPDLGDTLFNIAVYQLRTVNSLVKLGHAWLGPLSRSPWPPRPASLPLALQGPARGTARGEVQLSNRLAHPALPSVRCTPFRNRAGSRTRENNEGVQIDFVPPGEVPPGGRFRVSMVVRLDDRFYAAGVWYFSDVEVLSDGESIAHLFVRLHVVP
jgi:hypothetical protein